IPQGWPLLIHATVFGPKDHPVEVAVDAVSLHIVDSKGSAQVWDVKPTTQPANRKADDVDGVAYGWVLSDSSKLAIGVYRVRAQMDGANVADARVEIVAPLAKPTPDQQADLLMFQTKGMLAIGDADGALKLADQWVKNSPHEVMAHHMRGAVL